MATPRVVPGSVNRRVIVVRGQNHRELERFRSKSGQSGLQSCASWRGGRLGWQLASGAQPLAGGVNEAARRDDPQDRLRI